jgi:transposase
MLCAEQNRRRLLRDRGLQRHLEAHIAWLDDAISRVEADLTTLIRSTPIWREADELLRSVPGVGRVTSCALIADLPELGHLDRRRIAALAGLAPVARDSGAFRGRRMIVGGRAHVRRILYMATVAAIKYNPAIRAFFQRLGYEDPTFFRRLFKRKVSLTPAAYRRKFSKIAAIGHSGTQYSILTPRRRDFG